MLHKLAGTIRKISRGKMSIKLPTNLKKSGKIYHVCLYTGDNNKRKNLRCLDPRSTSHICDDKKIIQNRHAKDR